MFYAPETRAFSYAEAHLPLPLKDLIRLEGQGNLFWDRDDVRRAVLATGDSAAPDAPAAPAERRRAVRGQESMPSWGEFVSRPRLLWLATAVVVFLAVVTFIAAGMFAVRTPAKASESSSSMSVAAYLSQVDAAVRNGDTAAYANLVDLPALATLMTDRTLEAYDALAETTPTPTGRSAIQKSYATYQRDVLAQVSSEATVGVPLYGLSAAASSAKGTTVTVTLTPQPVQEAGMTTVPTPTGTKVSYVFQVETGRVQLVRIDGLVPYLKTTALFLTRQAVSTP